MVSRISSGKFFSGLQNYLEKEQAQVIDKNLMIGKDTKELTREFLDCAEQNKHVRTPVKHHVISFANGDLNKLDNDKLRAMGREYLDKMGYGNHQYTMHRHDDTGRTHLHFCINKVDIEGNNYRPKFEEKQSREVLEELEIKYGLEKTGKNREQTQEQEKAQTYNRSEKEMEKRLNEKGELTIKQEMRRDIKKAVSESRSQPEMVEKLKAKGIETQLNSAGNGYTFEREMKFKGSTLDKKLSYANINKQFEINKGKQLSPELWKKMEANRQKYEQSREQREQEQKRQQDQDRGLSI